MLLPQQGALKTGVGSGLQMEPSWASGEDGRHLPRSYCSLGPAWELSTGYLTEGETEPPFKLACILGNFSTLPVVRPSLPPTLFYSVSEFSISARHGGSHLEL